MDSSGSTGLVWRDVGNHHTASYLLCVCEQVILYPWSSVYTCRKWGNKNYFICFTGQIRIMNIYFKSLIWFLSKEDIKEMFILPLLLSVSSKGSVLTHGMNYLIILNSMALLMMLQWPVITLHGHNGKFKSLYSLWYSSFSAFKRYSEGIYAEGLLSRVPTGRLPLRTIGHCTGRASWACDLCTRACIHYYTLLVPFWHS